MKSITKQKHILLICLLLLNILLSTLVIVYDKYWYIFIVILAAGSLTNSINAILLIYIKLSKWVQVHLIDKVKNTTVGDAASAIASTTPIGMAYNLAKKAANSETAKQIKEDLKPERIKKGLKNIKSAIGLKRGGVVKKKMKNGGSLSGLKASTKRVGPSDACGPSGCRS
jgi:membrane-associated HD superfamily phosphohydrolase